MRAKSRVQPATRILEKEVSKRRREFLESLYRPFRAVKIRVRRVGSEVSSAHSLVQAVELAMDAAMAQVDDLVEEYSADIDAFVEGSEALVAPMKKTIQESADQIRGESAVLVLPALVHAFASCQKIRIALSNKCQAAIAGRMRSSAVAAPIASLAVQFSLMEDELLSHIARALARHPAGEFLAGIRGIGPVSAGRVVGLIPMYDANSFTTFSKLRAYAGLAPGRDKHIKNVRSCFNVQLRTALHVCWSTWNRLYRVNRLDPNGHYLDIYLKWEKQYAQTKPDWTLRHRILAARRKCLDVFLQNIWHQWRTKEGWPVRGLYVHDRLNHEVVYSPEAFWDQKLSKNTLKQWSAGKIN